MKKLLLVAISLFIMLTSCEKAQEKKLIGRWEVDSYSNIYQGTSFPIEETFEYWDVDFEKNGTIIHNIEGSLLYGTYTIDFDPHGVITTEFVVNDTMHNAHFTITTLSEHYLEVKGFSRFSEDPLSIRLFKKE